MVCANLTEPGVRRLIKYALSAQKAKRDSVKNFIFNVLMLILLGGSIFIVLYVRRGKGDKRRRKRVENERKKEYIIEKLQTLAAIQSNNGLITTLPKFGDFIKG